MSLSSNLATNSDPNERKYRKYSDSELQRMLLRYILRYKRSLVIVLGTLLIASAVGVIVPALLGFGVNYVIAGNFEGLVLMLSLSVGFYLASYLSESKRNVHMQVVGQNVIRDIRRETFVKLQKLSPSYFSRRETGRIMSYITNDVDALSDFVTFQVPQVLAGLVVIVSMIVIMFIFNVKLTLVSLVVIPLLVLISFMFQSRIQESFVETRKKIAVVTSKLQEGISGVRVTQSFVKEKKVSQSFDEANNENLQVNLRANKLTSLFNSLVQIIESFGLAIVLWYGSTEILGGQMTVGILLAFLIYINNFFSPIIQLTSVYNSYQSAVTGLDRVMQVLYTDIEVKPPSSHAELNEGQHDDVPTLSFNDVTFGYDPEQLVLEHVSFELKKNEVVAIVGPTGAGKSSIVNLAFRFYDPQQGLIRFNGVDLRNLDFSQFRKKIGVIPQEPFLFSTSVRGNIRYGKPEASDEEVEKIARELGIDEFVRSLPDGYGTILSEGATNLSTGQKQLVCFARAFLPNPEVLIMDEATSGVDPISELQLQRALSKMIKERSTIIIAHRLSTIRLADKLIFLRSGRIVEEGSLQDLVEMKDGAFRAMYSLQFQSR